jgi:anti-sigma factor RsiW
MHCTIEDLVALRDGEGSVWARRHVEECAECQAERERLYQRVAQLKALPALRPPRDRWPAIRDTVLAERSRRRQRWLRSGLAVAAAIVGIIIIRPINPTQALGENLAQAKQQSAQLETTLRDYDSDSRVMSGREADLTAQLEDQIAVLDGHLSQLGDSGSADAQLVDLWRQRVGLMQQLVQVHITRAKYVGL